MWIQHGHRLATSIPLRAPRQAASTAIPLLWGVVTVVRAGAPSELEQRKVWACIYDGESDWGVADATNRMRDGVREEQHRKQLWPTGHDRLSHTLGHLGPCRPKLEGGPGAIMPVVLLNSNAGPLSRRQVLSHGIFAFAPWTTFAQPRRTWRSEPLRLKSRHPTDSM